MKKTNAILLILLFTMSIPMSAATDSTTVKRKITRKQALRLGDKYLNGINTDVDYEKAELIFRKLSDMNYAPAMNRLAGMYRQGFGVEVNKDSAIALYTRAMNLKNGKATYNLAMMYKMGEGVDIDYEKAVELYQKSYDLGYKKKTVYGLGYMSYKGLGTEQDYKKAYNYFLEGDSSGNASCQYFAGLCLVAGNGVAKDIEKGKEYIEKAMMNGSELAAWFIADDRIKNYETQGVAFRSAGEKPRYRNVKNTARKELGGVWNGKIVRYDWSGKKVVEEKPLSLQLDFNNDRLSGTWTQEDTHR